MLRSSWRFNRQLPTWRRAVFSLSGAVRAAGAGAATRSVSSRSAPSSQRAAAMAVADNIIEGQQAAMDAAEHPLKEAARPFSDIPGKKILRRTLNFFYGSKQPENMHYSLVIVTSWD